MTTRDLFRSEWFTVVQTDDQFSGTGDSYTYVVEPDIVYLVPFQVYYSEHLKKRSVKFLLRQQYTPHLGIMLRPMSGKIEKEDPDIFSRAIKELKEEGGFIVTEKDLKFVTCLKPTPGQSKKSYVILADVSKCDTITPPTDNTVWEQNSSNLWVDYYSLKNVLTNSDGIEFLAIFSLVYFLFGDVVNEMDKHNQN